MDLMTFARTYWDRLAAAGCTIAGAIMLVLGWRGVSQSPYPAEQIPYVVSDGLGGLFLLGLAALLWLSADLRDEWSKLDALDGHLERLIEIAGEPAAETEIPPAPITPARRSPMARAPRVSNGEPE